MLKDPRPIAFRLKHPVYTIGAIAGILCVLVILVPAVQLLRWGSVTRSTSSRVANTGIDAHWVQLRGLVPATITVFMPTWLPPDFRDMSPSYVMGGGGNEWTYSAAYSNDRISGDRPYLVFTEDPATRQCPSPPCGQRSSSLGITQPLPPGVERQLPHAILFVGHQAPEIVLRWRVGIYVYRIEAHQESRADVLHVAVYTHGISGTVTAGSSRRLSRRYVTTTLTRAPTTEGGAGVYGRHS